jgi:hypothetical protein
MEIDVFAVLKDDLFDRPIFDAPGLTDGAASFAVSFQQFFFVFHPECEREALSCADEVADDFHRVALDVLEGQHRPVNAVGLPEEFTDLVTKINFVGYREQFAALLQNIEKVS